MSANRESGSEARVSSPADTWDIIGFSIGTVHCDQKIRDLTSERCLPVDRRFTDITVQKDLVALYLVAHFLHKFQFPHKNGEHKAVFLFLVAVVGTELPGHIDFLSDAALFRVHQPFGNHERYVIHIIAQPVHRNLYHIKAFSVNLVTEREIRNDLPYH